MKFDLVKDELSNLLEELMEQFHTIDSHEKAIPQIEMDIFMRNIQKLYENTIFLKKINEEGRHMLPQFKRFLGRIRAGVRRIQFIPTIKEEYQRRLKTSGMLPNPKRLFKLLDVEDKSSGLAKRYLATIIIPENFKKERIKEIIFEATKEVKKKQIYGSHITKKAWKGKDANIVWLGVFTKEKRKRDMWFFDGFDYYICKTEWSDKNTEGIVQTFDEVYKDIKICWSRNY